MVKNLKINIKNAQIAEAVSLKNAKKNESSAETTTAGEAVVQKAAPKKAASKGDKLATTQTDEAPTRKVRAKTKSSFAHAEAPIEKKEEIIQEKAALTPERKMRFSTPEETAKEASSRIESALFRDLDSIPTPSAPKEEKVPVKVEKKEEILEKPAFVSSKPAEPRISPPVEARESIPKQEAPDSSRKLGPTGRHINELRTITPSESKPRSSLEENTAARGERKEYTTASFARAQASTPDRRPPRERDSGSARREGGDARPPRSFQGQGNREQNQNRDFRSPRPPYNAGGQEQPREFRTARYNAQGGDQGRDFRGPRPPFAQGTGEGRSFAPRQPGTGFNPANRPPRRAPMQPSQIFTVEELAEIEERKKAIQKKKLKDDLAEGNVSSTESAKKGAKVNARDAKTARKDTTQPKFDGRDRQGLRDFSDEDSVAWRKRKALKDRKGQKEDTTIRPSSLKVRLPITLKDLAAEMKLKAAQLVAKLFLQGLVVTLNDLIDDETVIQLLGHEFGCEITIDTSAEEKIRITNQTIKQEVLQSDPSQLITRPPIVAFMGHVDHGKTSLIDAIRKSNRVAGEAGAITQHIGAFSCDTPVGRLTILDTPGHEAFSAMRARGAEVTDIIILVISGEEGMKPQTLEAINQAKQAGVTIIVAINKCDRPNFDPETVYRQLAEQELLPEAWGGETITINCSALTGEGIPELLEMIALQSEVMELKANPEMRARGTVIESEMHTGMGVMATLLVQNGTLHHGDAIVFEHLWGKVKTMRNEFNQSVTEAGPSAPVVITGLSGVPSAGEEFIIVSNEKEAREIAEARQEDKRSSLTLQKKSFSLENLLQQASDNEKKVLKVILRADVQGSMEAVQTALMKIKSDKIRLDVISADVGEISESDVQLAATSKAVIIGFHTEVEAHAESLIKQYEIDVRLYDIIYKAIEDVQVLMVNQLDKIAEEHNRGKAEVRATFKSSQLGVIAGCQVIEGSIVRNHNIRVIRGKDIIWKGSISSLKRVKEDVKEVQKGIECGILLNGFSDFQEGDILQTYEIVYITQTL